MAGALTHGRQAETNRAENGLMNFVHNWDNRAIVSTASIAKMKYSQRDLITENMKPIYDALKKEQHLKTVKGQFVRYYEMAAAQPVRCYELHGKAIETLLAQVVGDMKPKELKERIDSSTLGTLNKFLNMLRTFVAEEMDEKLSCVLGATHTQPPPVPSRHPLPRSPSQRHARPTLLDDSHPLPTSLAVQIARACSGEAVIHDRIAFAGANWKPLRQLRDAWATEASTWLVQYSQLKRAYDREQEATRAAEARAEAMGRRGTGDGDGPPAKRMRVRIAQVAKERNPGSLTVSMGDKCIFVEPATNPLWSRVKMSDDGRVGLVSASRLEDDKDEEVLLGDPSEDDEEPLAMSDDEEDARRDARRPSMQVIAAEVARVFEDEAEFDLDFFCEREAMSGYSSEDVECTLQSLAALDSPMIFIVEADVNPYKKRKPRVA